MASSYDQTPGNLPISFTRGDTMSALVDFSIDLTGYSFSGSLVSVITGSEVVPLTVSVVSASNGQVNVSLTPQQTAALARGTYAWKFVWTQGLAVRTALTGFVEAL
ncbi:MAG: hypothetical protein EBR82_14995 [Caulobacteraceae bacterium]|nr:hypothetical protein [Caulobacteraceae bacterium]